MEFNSFGPAVGRLGSDSSRGAKVEAGGLSPPSPLTLTTAHYELETTINFWSQKVAISGIDTLSLDPSIKKIILVRSYKSNLYVNTFVTIAFYYI